MKKVLKTIGIVLLILALIVAGYLAYVLIDYHRIDDNLSLDVKQTSTNGSAKTGTPYKIVSYNIGFGAYESDYSFFMDGGTESWAWSKEHLLSNMDKISDLLQEQKADYYLLQEVDSDSTRTYHVDETSLIRDALPDYDSVWGQNYDSPFLMYPLTQPHGASKSGLMTFSSSHISCSLRRSLPIEESLMRLVDLDRCYTVSRILTENGKELLLYCVHLSAYTSDGTIAVDQLKTLLEDMQHEYEQGNYCVCGGDFNKDLLGNSDATFNVNLDGLNWVQSFPNELLEGTNLNLIAPLNIDSPVPSCRNADKPYHEGQIVLTVDGFLVSNNITAKNAEVIDTGFSYSDHNPVQMTFTLLP